MHPRGIGLISLLPIVLCATPLCAQTPAPAATVAQEPVSVFRANAGEVAVDVVVTKGSDEPVLALRKQDFEVKEDGKPVAVVYFEEHTAKALPPGALPALPKMPPNVYTNVPPAPESDSVNVLLLDSLNTEAQEQSYVHGQIVNFLKNMHPGVRCAIFILGSKLRFVQGFTTDSSVLLAVLNDKKTGFSTEKDATSRSRSDDQADKDRISTMAMEMNGHMTEGIGAVAEAQGDIASYQYAVRASMTLEALQYLARYLGGVPGRKNLIWFASSFPVTVFPSSEQTEAMNKNRVNSNEVKQTADLLTTSKVAVYPIGAEGMMNDHWMEAGSPAASGVSPNVSGASHGSATLNGIAGAGGENDVRAMRIAAMEQLAADTGGKAFFNTNDLNAAMTQAINDGSHYYTLVYRPANKKMDGRYRHIEIKLNQGRYKLAYRRGYNADDSLAPEVKMQADPLQPLLSLGLPSATQLLYGVRVVPANPQPAPNVARAGKNPKLAGPVTRYNVDFMIRWTDVELQPTGQQTRAGKIQLDLLAYDRDGHPVNWAGGTQMMNLEPDNYAAIQKSGIPAHMEIDLPNTGVNLVTGVYDWNSGKAGTLEIPIHPTPPSGAAAQSGTPQPQ